MVCSGVGAQVAGRFALDEHRHEVPHRGIVLVLGHLGTGRLLVGIAHASVFVFYLTAMTQSATGSDLLVLQGLALGVTAPTLWARRATARAAYWRRVHAVARFREDVAAARRTYR